MERNSHQGITKSFRAFVFSRFGDQALVGLLHFLPFSPFSLIE
jgi:hypothetical protein